MTATSDSHDTSGPPDDAVDVLLSENHAIQRLLAEWRRATATLEGGDDVEVRWDRGSAAKLLVQHIAARESAKDLLAGRFDERSDHGLAARVRGDHEARKAVLRRLDELGRGHQAITLSNPEMDEAVERFGQMFDVESAGEDDVAELRGALGSQEDAPSAKQTYAESSLRPNVEPAWYDRVGVLRRLRASYQHARFAPRGGTRPGIDSSRERPGDRP